MPLDPVNERPMLYKPDGDGFWVEAQDPYHDFRFESQ